jgi:hypothetical protein
VKDALASLSPALYGLPPTVDFDVAMMADTTFAAARGMAVYARRRQEAPGPCVEYQECEEMREKERSKGQGAKTEL